MKVQYKSDSYLKGFLFITITPNGANKTLKKHEELISNKI